MILKRILFLFTSVALLAGCSSGRAPEIRAICLRDDIGNYIIKWETDPHTDGTMKLYVSDTPNSFDMSRPCSYADINDGRVTYITNDNITRKYSYCLSTTNITALSAPARYRWTASRTCAT